MAMRNKPKVKYSGVLATPMTLHVTSGTSRGLLAAPSGEHLRTREAEDDKKNLAQMLERTLALFNHFGVPQGDYVTLVLRLAFAHVPGFRWREPGERGRGRPVASQDFELLLEIDALRKSKGLKRACEILSRRRESRCYRMNPETLRKRMTEAERASSREDNPTKALHDVMSAWRLAMNVKTDAVQDGADTGNPRPVERK